VIETSNAQIDTTALLQQVRDVVRRQQTEPPGFLEAGSQVGSRVASGRKYNRIPSWLPGFLQPFFRNQGAINRQLLHAVEQQQLQLQSLWHAVKCQNVRMSELLAEVAAMEAQQRQLATRLLEKLETAGTARAVLAEAAVELHAHSLDAFYVAFENQFRGTRAEIKERQRVYLPYVVGRSVLDLGCGRGEWLELLREAGQTASGVDASGVMVAVCRELGLDVQQADAIVHLKSLPDASVGVVTGFHIVEHLPFDVQLELFVETRRVLQPGGLAVFESPNCQNIIVGACNFYSDPTHVRPLFPGTAKFLLERVGLVSVEILYLSPAQGSPFNLSSPDSAQLHNWFFGPRDFAVIGAKPAVAT